MTQVPETQGCDQTGTYYMIEIIAQVVKLINNFRQAGWAQVI